MKKIFLVMIIMLTSLYASKMEFSDPKPTFDEPRLWMIKLSTSDKEVVNHTLNAINNVLKIYPAESLKVSVVVYANGMRAIRKDYDSHILTRIKSLMEYDVEFVACRNTMETMGWKDEEFIEDLSYVQAGVAEAIERVVGGWIDVTPYY